MPNRTMQPPVLKAKIRVMGEKIANNLQTMSELIDSGNINAAKNFHEKAAETFSEFEETSYELISQLDEDQHEEYTGKITDTWNNIDDMKIKIQNHISQENTTINFNTQDNNETTVTANSTADKSATNDNINTRAIGQQQTSVNRSLHNDQPETSNSAQRDNLKSFWYDRLAYSSSLNDQQNRVTGMGDTQKFNQSTEQPQQLSKPLSQPVPFNTLYVEAHPKMDLQKFNGEPSKWSDSYSRFSFMIGDTQLSDGQKIAYLQGLVIGKAKTTIEGFAFNRHLYKDAINELKQRFGNPNVIISNLLEKLINYRPPTTSLPWTIVNFSTFINTMTRTLQELNFEADLNSTTILKHATDKLPYSEEFKWNPFVSRQRNQQPTLADFNQWIKKIAEAHERSTHQGRSNTSLSTNSDKHQRNFDLYGNRQFHQHPTHSSREQQQQQQPTQNINNFSNNNNNNKNQYNQRSTTQMFQATRGSNSNNQLLPCVFNDGNHQLFHCPTFKAKTADERLQTVYQLNLRINRLGANHQANNCPSISNCREQGCGQRQNTMLHGANSRYGRTLTSIVLPNSQSNNSRGNGNSIAVISNKDTTTTKDTTAATKTTNLLYVMPVILHNKENKVLTYAFIDPGSSLTILLSKTQNRLTQRQQKFRIWKTTIATTSNRYTLWKTSICQS